MDYSLDIGNSPLTRQDLEKIDDLEISNLTRHHLRVLAHCLNCFKQISLGVSQGDLPNLKSRKDWCLQQPIFVKDQEFVSIFLEQLNVAGIQLEQIAKEIGRSPLELTLMDLIDFSLR